MTTPFATDSGEELVRARLDAAVAAVSPDLVPLTARGLDRGRADLRRRQRTTLVGVAAATLALVGGLAYAGSQGLLHREPGPTNNGQVGQLVRATPRGMAAAVLSHVDWLGPTVGVGGRESVSRATGRRLTAAVAVTTSSGDEVEFLVFATDGMRSLAGYSCDPPRTDIKGGTCHELHNEAGPRAYYVVKRGILRGEPTVLSSLAVRRHGQVVRVIETVIGSSEPVLNDTNLYRLATDPRVGLTTTSEMNARGEALQGFQVGDLVTRSQSSGSGTAPAPITSGTPATATAPAKPRH